MSNRIHIEITEHQTPSGRTFNAALDYGGSPEFGIPEFRIVGQGESEKIAKGAACAALRSHVLD